MLAAAAFCLPAECHQVSAALPSACRPSTPSLEGHALAASLPSPLPLPPPLLPQGGGQGEVHLRLTYWPFELLSGHKGASAASK